MSQGTVIFFLKEQKKACSLKDVSLGLGISDGAAQKALRKLFEKGKLSRMRANRSNATLLWQLNRKS